MPINPLPASFDDLSIFLAVVRAGGFREAAKRIGVSPSTVSETISRLETHLDVRLFTRTTRSVAPTEAGAALAYRIEPLFAAAMGAVEEVMSSERAVRGSLRLNVPGAVMVDILPPLIERFLRRHPEVRAEITVDDRLIDAAAAGSDAGIRYGEYLAQDMIAVPIGPRWQQGALAASARYLEAHGTPQHPRDLLGHACIRMRFASGALVDWEFSRDGETIKVDPPTRLVVSTAAAPAAFDLAAAGLGPVFSFRNWLEPQFANGALLPVLQDWWPTFEGPQLYFSNRFLPSPLRAFVDFIAKERDVQGSAPAQ